MTPPFKLGISVLPRDYQSVALARVRPELRFHDELCLAGPAEFVLERLAALRAVGVTEAVLLLDLGAHDQLDLIAREVMPRLT